MVAKLRTEPGVQPNWESQGSLEELDELDELECGVDELDDELENAEELLEEEKLDDEDELLVEDDGECELDDELLDGAEWLELLDEERLGVEEDELDAGGGAVLDDDSGGMLEELDDPPLGQYSIRIST